MSSDPSTFQSPEHTQVNQKTHTQIADNSYPPATADHPRSDKPDPTTSAAAPKLSHSHGATTTTVHDATKGGQSSTAAAGSSELAGLKVKLTAGLREIPDFPEKGILFVDIMPLFANIDLHNSLIRALELKVVESFKKAKVNVIVGLDARGFLFGPSLALRIGASFAPMRKAGKLPGDVVKSTPFTKEYGAEKPDIFEMQVDAVKKGQNVVIVDDIIATGGTAVAAGELVQTLGGILLGYVFLMEIEGLKGKDKLKAPSHILLGQEQNDTGSQNA